MNKLRNKLREPFQQVIKEKEKLLEGGWEQLESQKEAVETWPQNKKRLTTYILAILKNNILHLNRILQPLPNMKKYKKEKRRLNRVKFPLIFSGSGFAKTLKIYFLRFLNIIRILFILFIYLSILLLIVFGFIKLLNIIRVR